MAAQITTALVDALGGAGQVQVDAGHNASRVSIRPQDHGAGGHYRVATVTGATVSIGAAGISASLSMPLTAGVLILKRLSYTAVINTTVTTGTVMDAQAFVFRGGGTVASGGTAVALTLQKNKNSMATSFIRDFRVASTSAVTATGSKTNDTNPFGAGTFSVPSLTVAGSGSATLELYKADTAGQHEIVLGPTEGIEVQIRTAGPVTGSVLYYSIWEWVELASGSY